MACLSSLHFLVAVSLLSGIGAPHGDLHERIAEVSARIQATPNVASLYVERADLHRRHGDLEQALSDLGQAESLDESLISIPFVRALVAMDRKEHARALDCAHFILEREPRHAGAEEIRFRCLLADGKLESAFQSVERVLAATQAPRPDLYILYAQNRERHGEDGNAAALEILERGLLRTPGHPEIERYAQALEVRSGNWKAAALRMQRRATRERADIIWEEWAEVTEAAGLRDEARAAAERALASWRSLPARLRAKAVEQIRGERLALLVSELQP